MNYKVKELIEKFTAVLSRWDGIECITLNEAAIPTTLDPYFALILDVFRSGDIPSPKERLKQYGDIASAFETTGSKDRFLVGDIPVRFEFKSTKEEDELVTIASEKHESLWLIKNAGTYGFYRLANGEILFSRGDWINKVRSKLSSLSNVFWKTMRLANQSKMEHFLSDLGAALIRDDDFFYLISESGFIKYACMTLFSINKKFEPSHRAYYKKVTGLPVVGETFCANLEAYLKNSEDMTPERRFSIAQVIAKEIITLH
ncbi:hypothetical protein FACS1894190_09580 [Spirochaetia bacterium]|nr:hypothetical protein FACS1894190_09580 [Spirochaetia bacterium]